MLRPLGEWQNAILSLEVLCSNAVGWANGATVLLDGKMLCKETPCARAIASGRYRLSMHLERHVSREETFEIAAGQMVSWLLDPDFGRVSVETVPVFLR